MRHQYIDTLFISEVKTSESGREAPLVDQVSLAVGRFSIVTTKLCFGASTYVKTIYTILM